MFTKNKHKPSLWGGVLLMAGSCIGAGMLALPIMTGLAGFIPSLLMFFVAWVFMTLTGLFLVEMHSGFTKRSNLISMVEKTLGKKGKIACWVLYLFLFYSLLLAYISGVGALVSSILIDYFHLSLAPWSIDLIFVTIFGCIVYAGTHPVDLFNRVLMIGKIGAFLVLVYLGVQQVRPSLLLHSSPQFAVFSLPILVISFGFHNMIPSLHDYFDGNIAKLKKTILLGGGFALIVYLIWQIVVLGIVPLKGEFGILSMMEQGGEASQALMGILGSHWISYFATLLGLCALLTSFLGQALSLAHFLADGLKISYKKHEEIKVVILALCPSLIFAIAYPGIFLKSLNFAGGICAVILFGIMPVLMIWQGRYVKKIVMTYRVRGGKPLLIGVFIVAVFIAFFQISQMVGAPYLPKAKEMAQLKENP